MNPEELHSSPDTSIDDRNSTLTNNIPDPFDNPKYFANKDLNPKIEAYFTTNENLGRPQIQEQFWNYLNPTEGESNVVKRERRKEKKSLEEELNTAVTLETFNKILADFVEKKFPQNSTDL